MLLGAASFTISPVATDSASQIRVHLRARHALCDAAAPAARALRPALLAAPFGALVAVDLRTGANRWEVPLGMMAPAGTDADTAALRALGSPNLGGPIITVGGLVFIAATLDPALRAFDIETGGELWRGTLPAGGRATPITYRAGERQYGVVAAEGGGLFGEGDAIVAFALPAAMPAAATLPAISSSGASMLR